MQKAWSELGAAARRGGIVLVDKTRIIVSESFVSQDENERRENVQRAMEEYAALCAKEPEQE